MDSDAPRYFFSSADGAVPRGLAATASGRTSAAGAVGA
jgi:hypothetical protein